MRRHIFLLIVLLAAFLTASAGAAGTSTTLTVSKVGTGTGTVVSSPAGINCGTSCTASFKKNSQVTLTASPASGSTVAGFSGGCVSSTSTCVVFMSVDRTVTVTFNSTAPPPQPACSDGADNDADGLTDYPVDGGCGSASDTSEVNPASGPEDVSGVPAGYVFCAWEGSTCSISSSKNVVFGAHGNYTAPVVKSASFSCDTTTFGDPAAGKQKACFIKDASPPPNGHMKWFRNCLGSCPNSISPAYAASFDIISQAQDFYAGQWGAAGAKVIAYDEIGTCYDSWDGPQPFTADCLNGGWELRNADGSIAQVINPNCGPTCTVTEVDPGNPGYQQFEYSKILYGLQHGWSPSGGVTYAGLYFDNYASGICSTTVGSKGAVNYPVYGHNGNLLYSNDHDFQNAELSFTQNVIVPLMNQGYYVGANSRGGDCPPPGGTGTGFTGPADKAWASRYAQYFSNPLGFNFIEDWMGWDGPGTHFPSGVGCDDSDAGITLSGDSAWCLKWDEWIDAMAYSDSLPGFNRYNISYYGSYPRQCRYTVASRFLTWNGSTGGITAASNPPGSLPACEQLQLGAPLNARYKVGPALTCPTNFPCSAWRRDFANGYVIVNPTQQTVTIGSDTIPSGDAVLHQGA